MDQSLKPEIKALPKGIPFTDYTEVRNVKKKWANNFHEQHHSYINTERHNSVVNHGIFFKGEWVATISYAYPLMRKFKEYCASEIIEVARVSVALDMDNLASHSMSISQDKFTESYAKSNGVQLLFTLVADGNPGSMFKALEGKGWIEDGVSKGHQAGNRGERNIRDQDKIRFYCKLDTPKKKQLKLC